MLPLMSARPLLAGRIRVFKSSISLLLKSELTRLHKLNVCFLQLLLPVPGALNVSLNFGSKFSSELGFPSFTMEIDPLSEDLLKGKCIVFSTEFAMTCVTTVPVFFEFF